MDQVLQEQGVDQVDQEEPVVELELLEQVLHLHLHLELLEEQVQVFKDLVLQVKTVVHIIIFLVVVQVEVNPSKVRHLDLDQPQLVV